MKDYFRKQRLIRSLCVWFAVSFCCVYSSVYALEQTDEASTREAETKVNTPLKWCLNKAQGELNKGREARAREYIRKAYAVKNKGWEDLENKDIWKEEAKEAKEAKRKAEREEKEAERQAEREEKEAKRKAEKEEKEAEKEAKEAEKENKKSAKLAKELKTRLAKEKIQEKKTKKYIKKAQAHLDKENYSEARQYAYKAREDSPENSELAEVITNIDKQEMFGEKKTKRIDRKQKSESAVKRVEKTKNQFHAHDEGKGWTDHIAGIFKRKTEEINKIQQGKTYTIDECKENALSRSQRMIMADKQVKLAEMRIWEARRELFPEVAGKVERSYGKIGIGEDTRHYQGEKYKVEVKQNLFDGMATWFSLRQAHANLEIVKLEREKVKNEIIEEVKKAYYNLDKTIKALAIQEDYQKRVNELYGIAEASFQQELIPKAEYLKVKGQNMQADFQRASSSEDINLAEMILFQALSLEPDQCIKIKLVEQPKGELSIGLENCYSLAMANQPEFRVKEKMIEYYDFERKIKKAKGWPKIDFNGSFGKAVETYQPTEVDTEQRDLSPEWYAGVKGSVPIWGNSFEYNYVREKWAPVFSTTRGTETATSYFSLKFLDDLSYFSDLQEARVGFESAKYEYLKAKNDLAVVVKESYFKYRKALLQISVTHAQVEHQSMFVKVLEERRRFGEMETSKVIEEYEKLAEHEYGLIRGETDYFISIAELNKAIGVDDYFEPESEGQEDSQEAEADSPTFEEAEADSPPFEKGG
ncbi:MAG: TolC family protein [Candidatus Omnitrophota bacterium]